MFVVVVVGFCCCCFVLGCFFFGGGGGGRGGLFLFSCLCDQTGCYAGAVGIRKGGMEQLAKDPLNPDLGAR